MKCYFRTRENKTWAKGEIHGFVPIGHSAHALVLPEGKTKLLLVESDYVELSDENPTVRVQKEEAEKLKIQAAADAKQVADSAKAAAKARILAEAKAKADADAEAEAEKKAEAEVASMAPVAS